MTRPAWADEPVDLVEHDPAWRGQAAEEMRALRQLLAPWLDGGIHHVGSTAVADLPAKPILDLMAGVADLTRAPEADGVLADAGWALVPPELDERPWRRFHVKPHEGRRFAHLMLVEPGHPRWNAMILLRDRLRADTDARRRYARVKRRAATGHHRDRERYTRAKARVIADVLDDDTA